MDQATCGAIYLVVMALAAAWWLVDLWIVRALGSGAPLAGEVLVDCPIEGVGKAILRGLRQSPSRQFGVAFKTAEREDRRLKVEKAGALICNQPQGLWMSDICFEFEPSGDQQTRVRYEIGRDKILNLLSRVGSILVFAVALPGVGLVGLLVGLLVVPSENPVVRWQVLQSLQVAHLLWPPLLIAWFASLAASGPPVYVEQLLAAIEEE